MAEEQQQPKQAEEKTEKKTDTTETPKSGGVIQWVIIGVILIVMMTVGFFLGNFLAATPKQAEAQQQEEQTKEDTPEDLFSAEAAGANKDGWFYDQLEPIATNLKDPGSTRYVRAALVFEMVPGTNKEKVTELLNTKKPIITNLLNIYFAGLSVDDVNSDKNLRRIQYELINILNENLAPNSKPIIKQILFQEFGVQ